MKDAINRVRANFPAELRDLAQWVVWRYEQRQGQAKPTKVPYHPSGHKASSTDPRTWSTFETVTTANDFDGIGFVVTEHDPYCGIDLDACVGDDGQLSESADRWVRSLASYTEVSPSQRGVRVWVRGRKPGPRCKHVALGVELYDNDRFFTVTGWAITDVGTVAIENRQTELNALYAELFPPEQPKTERQPQTPGAIPQDDEELLTRMFAASNGAAIHALWHGDTSGHNGDDSSADLALCMHLAFWTGRDEQRMDRLFRRSGLYREKWERQDYRDRTIGKAIDGTAEVYREPEDVYERLKWMVEEPTEEPEAATPEERNPLDVDVTEGLNLGWIDDCTALMHELTGSQVSFNQLTALVTAAAAIQRKARVRLSFGTIFPNIYAGIVAPSTSFRKSTAMNQARSFLHTAMLENLIIPAHGSVEGLMQQLSETPNALMIRDEVAPLLASDKVRYLKDMKQTLTELYGCEPVKRRLRMEEIKITSPYLNVLGATTPDKFYSSTTPSDWADGFLPRWLWALPEGDPYWDATPTMMTVETIARIQKLILPLMNLDKREEKDFILQGESLAMWSKWRIDAEKAAFAVDDENAAAIIGRYATYAIKFALILASVNDSWGIITEATMQTAINLADNYKAVAYRLLSEAENHKVTGSNIMKCFMVIKRKSLDLGRGVTAREVGQYTSLRKMQLTPCLDKLEELGAVISQKVGRTKQFIPAVDELQPRKWT